MATNAKDIIPFTATHPGHVLLAELEARELETSAFAISIGMSEDDMRMLLMAKKAVSPVIAESLENALGIPAHIWMNLQERYEYVTKELQSMSPSMSRHPNRPYKGKIKASPDRMRI